MAEPIKTKKCPKCKQIKSLSEFYKNRSRKDGLDGWCKSCQKAYRQSESFKAAVAKYQRTPNGKATRSHWNARHPNYVKATSAVNHAITADKLPQPDTLQCNYCPTQAEQYHHHKGYAKKHWLNVKPTCCKCHVKIHKKSTL